MKKTLSLITLALGVSSSFAQDLTDKKGRQVLPQAEDWGISIEATPFINLAKDAVHFLAPSAAAAPTFNSLNDKNPKFSVAGKYFIDNKTAYRGVLRIYDQTNTTVKSINKMNTAVPPVQTWPNGLDPEKVEDSKKTRDWAVGFGGGIEKRKGTKYRLQGYYGGEATMIIAGGGEKYSYGNDVVTNSISTSAADDGVAAYSTNFGGNVSSSADHDERTLLVRNGKTFGLAIRGYVGVEYFFTSKMSLGGEFGWGLGWARTGRGSKTVEGLDRLDDSGAPIASGAGSVVGDTKVESGDITRDFFFGSDRDYTGNPKQLWMNSYSPAGNLSLNFYF